MPLIGNLFRYCLLLCVCLACGQATPAGELPTPPADMSPAGQAHYVERVQQIDATPRLHGGLLFLGDSLIEGGAWQTYFPNTALSNQGIGWDTVQGLQNRVSQTSQHRADKIVLMIGTNDLGHGRPVAQILAALDRVLSALQRVHPEAHIYLHSVLPREEALAQTVTRFNLGLRQLAEANSQIDYVDLHPQFAAPTGALRAELSYDGVHLNAAGYALWAQHITPSITESSGR